MQLSLTAFPESGTEENTLKAEIILGNSASLSFQGFSIGNYQFSEFYNRVWTSNPKSLTQGKSPFESELYREIGISNDNTLRNVLLRALIISFRHLVYSVDMSEDDLKLENLHHFICMETTGKLGPQPLIYFISDSASKDPNVAHLHKLALLHRYNLTRYDGYTIDTYFMPFHKRSLPPLKIGAAYSLWRTILREYEMSISKFIHK